MYLSILKYVFGHNNFIYLIHYIKRTTLQFITFGFDRQQVSCDTSSLVRPAQHNPQLSFQSFERTF